MMLPPLPQLDRSSAAAVWMHGVKVVFGFSLIFLVFFLPAFLDAQVLAPGDGLAYYLPAFYAPKTLWTDLVSGGYPLMGDPQNMTWYPPARLLSLIPGTWNGFVLLAYVLAASFTYGYVYQLTASAFASTIAGLVYGMSGFMMAHLGHITIIHAAAWIPLLIWALERLRLRWTASWMLIGIGATACCVLAGHPQITIYGLGLGTFYALWRGGATPSGRWAYYRLVFGILMIGVALSAIQIIPTIELSRLSNRAAMTFAEFSMPGLPREQLLQFLFPHLFGGPFFFAGLAKGPYQLPYWGKWNVAEITGYVGFLPLMLAGIGVASRGLHQRSIVNFWLAVGLIAFLLAMGGDTVLGHWLYHVPIYNKFRAPGRHFVEVALSCSVLAGFGVAAIESRLVSRGLMRRTIGVSIAIIGVGLISVFWQAAAWQAKAAKVGIVALRLSPWENPAIGVPLILFGLSLIGLVLWYRCPQHKLTMALLVAIVILNLGNFGWFWEWRVLSPSRQRIEPNSTVQTYRRLLQTQHERMLTLNAVEAAFIQPFFQPNLARRQAMQNHAVFPNMTRLWGLPSLDAYSPFVLTRLSQLLQMTSGGTLGQNPLSLVDRSIDLMATRYLLLPHATAPASSPFAGSPRWCLVEQTASGLIYENLLVLPRTWLVSETIALPAAQVLSTIQASQLPDGRVYEPRKMALVEDPKALFETVGLQPTDRAEILKLEATRVTIQTQTAAPTFLVLSDVFYPGWSATIDGKPTKIFQTNYVQRGVQVPSGKHLVEYRFEPMSFKLGAGITLSALFGGVYGLWRINRSRRTNAV